MKHTNSTLSTAGRSRRGIAIVATMLIAMAFVVPTAGAQVLLGEANFSAYSTGTVIHADALEVGDAAEDAMRLLNADVAFSAATTEGAGLAGARSNEMGRLFSPDEPDHMSYARGAGLELDVAGDVPAGEADLHLAGLAEALAPPTDGPHVEEIGPVPAGPLAYASLARGEAYAFWAEDGACPTDGVLSNALGYVAHAQLLDAGDGDNDQLESPVVATDADDPDRRVSWSFAETRLDDQVDADGNVLGNARAVVAEQRMTIAPVTLFAGLPIEFTIELLGEWVLQATASGVDGGAHIHYGPGEVSPETPVLRVIMDDEIAGQLTLQDLLGDEGLNLPIGDPDLGFLANITLGEAPRAIGGDHGSEPQVAADGTSASAAVDVVRVQLLQVPETLQLAEVRIGHMEVEAIVPAGGILCPPEAEISVTKSVSDDSVQPGDTFDYTITIDNPFGCTLTDLRVVDEISADAGVSWTVDSTDPEADEVSDTRVVWEDVGPLEPGDSTTLTITVTIDADSESGSMNDLARATGLCDDDPREGEGALDGPTVDDTVGAPPLPVTGGGTAVVALLGLLMAAGAAGLLRRERV